MAFVSGTLKEGVVIPHSLLRTEEKDVLLLFPKRSIRTSLSEIAGKIRNRLSHSTIEEIIQSVEYEETK
jgi:hypothetical protein